MKLIDNCKFNFHSRGQLESPDKFFLPLFKTLPRVHYRGPYIPKTAIFCSFETANRFRFLLKTDTALQPGRTIILITDLLTALANSLRYVSRIIVFLLTTTTRFCLGGSERKPRASGVRLGSLAAGNML